MGAPGLSDETSDLLIRLNFLGGSFAKVHVLSSYLRVLRMPDKVVKSFCLTGARCVCARAWAGRVSAELGKGLEKGFRPASPRLVRRVRSSV